MSSLNDDDDTDACQACQACQLANWVNPADKLDSSKILFHSKSSLIRHQQRYSSTTDAEINIPNHTIDKILPDFMKVEKNEKRTNEQKIRNGVILNTALVKQLLQPQSVTEKKISQV